VATGFVERLLCSFRALNSPEYWVLCVCVCAQCFFSGVLASFLKSVFPTGLNDTAVDLPPKAFFTRRRLSPHFLLAKLPSFALFSLFGSPPNIKTCAVRRHSLTYPNSLTLSLTR
jgi:hypothetical protein